MLGTWTPDLKGQRILFETYWSSQGWKSNPSTPADAFVYAKQTGYMFDPLALSHSEALRQIAALRRRIAPTEVATAFADSLANHRLDLRSALGSYGSVLNLPDHKPKIGRVPNECAICRLSDSSGLNNLNTLSFERFKWGGVRHSNPFYALHDLSRFSDSLPRPTGGEGQAVLVQVLQVAGNMAPTDRPSDLLKALRPILPGNDHERRAAMSCLSYAGVLQPNDHEGFFEAYPIRREDPPEWKNDWPYPLSWWRGRDGINSKALKFYFPDIAT